MASLQRARALCARLCAGHEGAAAAAQPARRQSLAALALLWPRFAARLLDLGALLFGTCPHAARQGRRLKCLPHAVCKATAFTQPRSQPQARATSWTSDAISWGPSSGVGLASGGCNATLTGSNRQTNTARNAFVFSVDVVLVSPEGAAAPLAPLDVFHNARHSPLTSGSRGGQRNARALPSSAAHAAAATRQHPATRQRGPGTVCRGGALRPHWHLPGAAGAHLLHEATPFPVNRALLAAEAVQRPDPARQRHGVRRHQLAPGRHGLQVRLGQPDVLPLPQVRVLGLALRPPQVDVRREGRGPRQRVRCQETDALLPPRVRRRR